MINITLGSNLYNEIKCFAENKVVFHWELEFPELIKNGFDADVGNPPYVDVTEVEYSGVPLSSLKSSNLYAYIPEKAYLHLKLGSILSFITPMAIICSKRMIHLQEIFKKETWYLYNIDSSSNPGCLFKTIKAHLNIFHLKKDNERRIYTSMHRRFFQYERKTLFKDVKYYKIEDESIILGYTIPKISSYIEEKILKILFECKDSLDSFLDNKNKKSDNLMYYKRLNAPYYIFAYKEPPQVNIDGKTQKSSTINCVAFKPDISKYILMSTFYSSLYYWFWIIYSDCYDLHPKDINRFPLDINRLKSFSNLFEKLYNEIETDLDINCEEVTYNKANGITKYKMYRAKKSKHIFDKVDMFLGEKLGLSKEMVDFLINYDYNYRTN